MCFLIYLFMNEYCILYYFFFFQAEDGIRDKLVTGVQTCALPIWGNELGIDSRRVTWRRGLDMNDRALRQITSSLGGVANGFPREDGFDIVVASEVMAIFCLATDLTDLKRRLANIVIGYTRDRKPVRAGELKAEGPMAALLKDALSPNLVQTLEGTPAFIHGGPFANIAHGCNSVLAT